MDDQEIFLAAEERSEGRCRSAARWLRWIVARNPFYPLSAALLLYGIYRLSIDPSFIPGEESNLVFNFSAIGFYELLLAIAVLILGARRIWYDATVLVIIENGLVFVPCVLITHAVLIGHEMAVPFCIAAAGAALGRFVLIGRAGVPISPRLAGLGLIALAINVALPFMFRARMELDTADWLVPGRFCWLVALPCMVLLANLLEAPRAWSSEAHRQGWLPLLFVGLWVSATAIHLRAIDYISGLPFGLSLIAPVAWAACWTIYRRVTDFTPDPVDRLKPALLIPPALAPALDIGMGPVLLTLTAANVALFIVVFLKTRSRVALQMGIAAVALLVAGTPEVIGSELIENFTPPKSVFAAGIIFVIFQVILSEKPAVGLAGAIATASLPIFLLQEHAFVHLAIQAGATFLLVHSFRWDQPEGAGARQLRMIAAAIWIADSVLWSWSDVIGSRVVGATAMTLLGVCLFDRWLNGKWGARIVPIGAIIALTARPAHFMVEVANSSPTGLVAVIGSFLLFGLGTIAALTRSSWNHSASRNDK